MTVCTICLEVREDANMQVLPCGHSFCKTCIEQSVFSLVCPAPSCTYMRRVKVVIDEADEVRNHTSKCKHHAVEKPLNYKVLE